MRPCHNGLSLPSKEPNTKSPSIPQKNTTLDPSNLRPETELTRPIQISIIRLIDRSDGLHLNSSLTQPAIRRERIIVRRRRGATVRVTATIMSSRPAVCQSLRSNHALLESGTVYAGVWAA